MAGVLMLCLALVVGGCTSSGGGKTADLPDGEKPVGKVAVGAKDAWSEADLGLADTTAVTLRADAALLYGSAGQRGERLAVAEAASGELRWVRQPGETVERPAGGVKNAVELSTGHGAWFGHQGELLTAGKGEDWTVIAPYQTGHDGPRGVLALSGRDGTVVWKRELSVSAEQGEVRLLDADERRVLVALRDGEDKLTSFGLDAAKGERLWQIKDRWVYALAGDTALGVRTPQSRWEPGKGADKSMGRLYGVDAASGTERWVHGMERYRDASLRSVVPGRVVMNAELVDKERRSQYEDTVGIVIDTGTGREVRREKDTYRQCASDAGLLACALREEELVTVRAGRSTKPASAERGRLNGLSPSVAHGDRVYLSGKRDVDGKQRDRFAVVDRAGNPVLDEADGVPLAASATRLALRTDAGGDRAARAERKGLVVVRPVGVDGKEPKEPSRPAKPKRADLAWEKEPLWSLDLEAEDGPRRTEDGARGPLTSLRQSWLHGGTVVLYGRAPAKEGERYSYDGRLLGLDARTGKERWRVDADNSLPDGIRPQRFGSAQLVDVQGGLVLLSYEQKKNGAPGEGVAAVSVKDGSVRWTHELDGGMAVRLVDTDGERFAVTRSRREGNRTVATAAEVYDLDSRRRLMSASGHEAEGLAGDTLVTHRTKLPYWNGSRTDVADVVGFDATSGTSRWKLSDRYRRAEVARVVDGAVVTNHATGAAVLDPKSAEELATVNARVQRCHGDGEPLLVCGSDHERDVAYPVSVELRAGKATVRELPHLPGDFGSGGSTPEVIGRMFFTPVRDDSRSKNNRFGVLDARGREINDELPGKPVALSKKQVLRVTEHSAGTRDAVVTVLLHTRT